MFKWEQSSSRNLAPIRSTACFENVTLAFSVSERFPNKADESAESHRQSVTHTQELGWDRSSPASSHREGTTGTATSPRHPAGHQIHDNLSPKLLCCEKFGVLLGQNGHSLLPLISFKTKTFYLIFKGNADHFFQSLLPSFELFSFVYFEFYTFNLFYITILYYNFLKNTPKLCNLA